MATGQATHKHSKRLRGPTAVGALTSGFVAPVAAAKGTAFASLSANWDAIAGPSLGAFTKPLRFSKSTAHGAASPRLGHLVVQVQPHRALELQYGIPLLIERINASLGTNAVADIRVLQAPFEGTTNIPAAAQTPKAPVEKAAPALSKLEAALVRIGRGVDASRAA
jgi:hypothetical protein